MSGLLCGHHQFLKPVCENVPEDAPVALCCADCPSWPSCSQPMSTKRLSIVCQWAHLVSRLLAPLPATHGLSNGLDPSSLFCLFTVESPVLGFLLDLPGLGSPGVLSSRWGPLSQGQLTEDTGRARMSFCCQKAQDFEGKRGKKVLNWFPSPVSQVV